MTQEKLIKEVNSLVRKWSLVDCGNREQSSVSYRSMKQISELLKQIDWSNVSDAEHIRLRG